MDYTGCAKTTFTSIECKWNQSFLSAINILITSLWRWKFFDINYFGLVVECQCTTASWHWLPVTWLLSYALDFLTYCLLRMPLTQKKIKQVKTLAKQRLHLLEINQPGNIWIIMSIHIIGAVAARTFSRTSPSSS